MRDVTTRQDKEIIERNAAGVRSRAYTPGPYTLLENWLVSFVGRYVRELSASCRIATRAADMAAANASGHSGTVATD
jgi:phenylpropionate dioxygenase-like ring-hydroxylating dioxygenase large terminal subunit